MKVVNMLTANECLNIDDYAFKSSPESCSGNSCFTDCTDLPSDEDFLQQLSSDLDIPLLLNPGEDEMSLLNAFFDKSPEEIMSEIALPSVDEKFEEIEHHLSEFEQYDASKWSPEAFPNLYSDVKVEPDSCSSSASNKSASPIQSPEESVRIFEIKDEMKNEPLSPGSISIQSEIDTNNVIISPINQLKIVQNGSVAKLTPKRVPIQPKVPCGIPKNKVIVKSIEYKRGASNVGGTNVVSPPPPKVVVLENVTTVPITSVTQIPPTTICNSGINNNCNVPPAILKRSNNLINVGNIDPKILKRHQRKIKNRESACLSRKKKKDYLTSLENQVKDLTVENQRLKLQNRQLAERLTKYEGTHIHKSLSHVKTSFVLCMFVFSVAFNLDYVRNPFTARNQANLLRSDAPKVLDHHGRNLLWASDDLLDKNSSNFSPFSMCPAAINQTESARLASELERWIGRPRDTSDKVPTANVTKLTVPTYKSKSMRKRKQKKYTTLISSVYESHNTVGNKLSTVESNNEIQVFSPTPEQLYSDFFEAINRQDDTFYVVSFSDHHMLLPALHHNKTRRPKMSLIMPSVLPTENMTQPAFMPLMQIDCEVLDTRLIQIRYGSIPQHLRRPGNATYQNTEDVSKQSGTSTNYTTKKAYRPYFIKQKAVRDERDVYNIR
jgi:cyclic AMP-dependent transcription factor ATF-6 alpha